MSTNTSLNRRSFLKTAAAAVGAPCIITSLTRRAGAAPANERIVMGVIGPGKQGLGLLKRFMRIPEVQMVAACDVHATRRDYAARLINEHYSAEKEKGSYTGAKAYGDFREILARKDIDAVVIAVPEHWHAIMAIDACKAGKDVYCEKPLSLTIFEGRQMMLAARKYNRVFQTGSQQRIEYEGRSRKACELVRNGRIGALEKVQVCISGVGWPDHSQPCDLPEEPVPAGLDWDFWLGPAPKRGYNKLICFDGIPEEPPADMKGAAFYTDWPRWRCYKEFAGGLMTDWGAHMFDIAQWGLGMDESDPVEAVPAKGNQPLTFKYANGVTLEKVPNLRESYKIVAGVRFIGSKGVIEVTRSDLTLDPKNIDQEPIPPEGRLYEGEPEDHKRNFIDCVLSRKRPIADAEVGARSATVCHLGNLAFWNDRIIKYDPEIWQIVGDPEAAKWIDRPRRDPWQLPEI